MWGSTRSWSWRSGLRSQRGSQIVEFALIAPILLYLVLCIPVFSLFARSWIVISGAAREGARAASFYGVGDREGTAKRIASQAVYLEKGDSFQDYDDVAVQFDGGMVVVTVTYWQPTYLPLLHRILNPSAAERGEKVPLRATARFVIER